MNEYNDSILTVKLELSPLKEGEVISRGEYLQKLRAFKEYGVKGTYVVDNEEIIYGYFIESLIFMLENEYSPFLKVCFSESNRMYFEPVENGVKQ